MKTFTFIFFVALSLNVCLLMVAGCGQQRSSSNSNDSSQEGRGRETDAQTSAASAAMNTATQEQYDFTNVDRILERAAPRLGGCALVLIKDGKIIYRKSYCQPAPCRCAFRAQLDEPRDACLPGAEKRDSKGCAAKLVNDG